MPAQGQTAFQTPIQAEAPAKTTYVLNPYLAGVHVRDTFYTRCGKRILDIVICSLGLVIALPVWGIIALITLLTWAGPSSSGDPGLERTASRLPLSSLKT